MVLNNVKMAGTDEPVNVRVAQGKIAAVSSSAIPAAENALALAFDDAIIFPGLINSHDHLDFNLFPQLGDRLYNNYTEWGGHIHEAYKSEIADVLKIPVQLRSQWGVYKNLLCGVTTVVNHGKKSGLDDGLITVFEDTHCLHSVQFEKNWKLKLNNPFKIKLPVNIHAGEGDDWMSFNEMDQLITWNLLRRKVVGIHAVAMSEEQAGKFKAVVWCPESNYFLLGKTAKIAALKNHTSILFGTDSTLTGPWNMWGHLQTARKTKLLSDSELYNTLNHNAAKAWQLNNGAIAAGKDADLVVAKTKPGTKGFDSFFSVSPEDVLLVMHKGNIRLFDGTLLAQIGNVTLDKFSKIYINDACKYVRGDLPGLMEKISGYYPAADFPVSVYQNIPAL
jgi:cytosine/adenosine deaminase-related metal-dependent hydrolase